MGLIIKEINVKGNRGEKRIKTLFDTGASVSFIKKDLAEELGISMPLPEKLKFGLGDGKGEIKAEEVIFLCFEIEGTKIYDDAIITDFLAEDLIIGAKTMQVWKIGLVPETERVIIDPEAVRLRLI